MLYIKKRILRRKSRKRSSPYRVHCDKINRADELLLNIYDENDKSNPIHSFRFSGARLHSQNSIHFNASEINSEWQITFSKVQPD